MAGKGLAGTSDGGRDFGPISVEIVALFGSISVARSGFPTARLTDAKTHD